jgi:hypothetical protein
MFFGVSMFNLSGAINVLLLLFVRPRILLFIPPVKPVETNLEFLVLSDSPARLIQLDSATNCDGT